MATTALFAELVVGGMQTLGWLAILATLWFAPQRLLGELRSLTLSEGLVLVIGAYSAGVIFDRLWDRLLKPWDRRIMRKLVKKPERLSKIRAAVFSGDPVRANFIDQIRLRMRVVRATLCNAALGALSAGLVWILRQGEPWVSWFAFIGVLCGLFALVAAYAYGAVTTTYYKALLLFDPQ